MQEDLAPFRWWQLGKIFAAAVTNLSIFFDKTFVYLKIGLTLWIRYVVMDVMCGFMLNVTTLAIKFSRFAYHTQLAHFMFMFLSYVTLYLKSLELPWSLFEGYGAH